MAEAKYQAYSGKAQKLAVDIGSASAFFEPEILEMEEDTLLSLIHILRII